MFKKNTDTNDASFCFKCNQSGHVKKDCPLLKPNANFNNFKKKKKKTF